MSKMTVGTVTQTTTIIGTRNTSEVARGRKHCTLKYVNPILYTVFTVYMLPKNINFLGSDLRGGS